MRKNGERDFIVGLDIGTSKVVAIVGEVDDNNEIEVIGIGSHPSRGLSRGVVVNIESTVHSIQKAVEEAELMAINSASSTAFWMEWTVDSMFTTTPLLRPLDG